MGIRTRSFALAASVGALLIMLWPADGQALDPGPGRGAAGAGVRHNGPGAGHGAPGPGVRHGAPAATPGVGRGAPGPGVAPGPVVAPGTTVIAPAPTAVVAPGAVAPVVTAPAATTPAATTPASTAPATKTAAAGGTTLATLPNNSVSVVIDGVQHFQFGASVYRPLVQGSAIVYLQVR